MCCSVVLPRRAAVWGIAAGDALVWLRAVLGKGMHECGYTDAANPRAHDCIRLAHYCIKSAQNGINAFHRNLHQTRTHKPAPKVFVTIPLSQLFDALNTRHETN